jgi:hypothetical protein
VRIHVGGSLGSCVLPLHMEQSEVACLGIYELAVGGDECARVGLIL